MAESPVLYEKRGRTAYVTLNRPEDGNAIDEFMALELRDACQSIVEDDDVYLAVITGVGGAFSRGAVSLPKDAAACCEAMARRRVAEFVGSLPKPVIASINGDALGQGLELALACDLRVAVKGAILGLDQLARGELPWDGGTQRLPRLLPPGIALDMVLTGRSMGAEEALAFGLVSYVVPAEALGQRTADLAEKIAAMAPIAGVYAKEAVLKGLDAPLDQGVRLEADLAVLLHTSRDRAEGIGAFLQKRKPRFTGE